MPNNRMTENKKTTYFIININMKCEDGVTPFLYETVDDESSHARFITVKPVPGTLGKHDPWIYILNQLRND